MEQGNSNLRERLLARLPQPENLAAYREETAATLARHERALLWERTTAMIMGYAGFGLVLITIGSPWGQRLDIPPHHSLLISAGILCCAGMMAGLGYFISRAKVDVLKEVKQVQLQVLELQASIEKRRE